MMLPTRYSFANIPPKRPVMIVLDRPYGFPLRVNPVKEVFERAGRAFVPLYDHLDEDIAERLRNLSVGGVPIVPYDSPLLEELEEREVGRNSLYLLRLVKGVAVFSSVQKIVSRLSMRLARTIAGDETDDLFFAFPDSKDDSEVNWGGASGKVATLSFPMRWFIYCRDGGRCAYCGRRVDWDEGQVDHVVPKSAIFAEALRAGKVKVGKLKPSQSDGWEPENLVWSCPECNARKGEHTPEEAGMKLRVRPSGAPSSMSLRHYVLSNILLYIRGGNSAEALERPERIIPEGWLYYIERYVPDQPLADFLAQSAPLSDEGGDEE